MDFSHVPVNSSTKLDDTLMEAVEPFDPADTQAFSAAYLSGSQAERYDVQEQECVKRANARIRESVQQVCRASAMGYTTLTPVHTQIQMKHGKAKNVMMPVWLLNTKYKDKTYTFAMNGQTGRMVGNLPVDGKKAFLWGAGLFAGITLLGYLGRYAMAVLSGVVFFAEYAGDQGALAYSLVYNLSYLGPETLICMVLACIPGMCRLPQILKQNAGR